MICYRDRMFCNSPNCKNECGRKLWAEDKETARRLDMPIALGYFCGVPEVQLEPVLNEERN